jgi:ATP phosphoribosyltransferase
MTFSAIEPATAISLGGIRLALPTGRLQPGVLALLERAGISVSITARNYRPAVRARGVTAKFLKPQTIPTLVALGACDLGFCGADWAFESGGRLIEAFDTGLSPVTIVAAAPTSLLSDTRLPDRPLVIASEYERWTRQWIARRGLNATIVLTRGTTEALPPEDADVIVDNTSTGTTLAANDLTIIDTIAHSTTRLYVNPSAMTDDGKRALIQNLVDKLRASVTA